jgi:hypothetical protein
MDNPYASPKAEPSIRTRTWSLRLPILVTWLYPFLLVGGMYGAWFSAWITLGHRPRPSLDDPKSIGMFVDLACSAAAILLIGFPAFVLAGLALQLADVNREIWKRLFNCVFLSGLWYAAIMFLRWDPFDVVLWIFD